MKLDTKLIHGGEPRPPISRSVVMPVFHGSTYIHAGETKYENIIYTRLSNTPNQLSVAEKLAEIEGGETALVTSSGMSAISTSLLAFLETGEHLLAQEDLYGGTLQFLMSDFPKLGRKVSFFSVDHLEDLETKILPETKAIYVESISNPLLKVPDFKRIVHFAKSHGLLSLVDNTFPSPILFNPIEVGFDIVLHSATKYLNGHSDLVGGCVVGTRKRIKEVRSLLSHLGGSMDAHTCYLLNRGLKTLSIRVQRQNETALRLAQALQENAGISVYHPGLPSHPHHGLARKYFRGFGAMISFELPDVSKVDKFLGQLKIPFVAPSLGGVETLVTVPTRSSHSGVDPETRMRLGVKETLVRISVGLEDVEDLINDFLTALNC